MSWVSCRGQWPFATGAAVLGAAVLGAVVLVGCGGGGGSKSPSNPTPPNFSVEVLVSGATLPTALAFAPDGSNRLFYLEKSGAVRIVENGSLRGQPFATLPVVTSGEQGLLGLAFDPNFRSNRRIYFYHTAPAEGQKPARNRVVRLTDQNSAGTGLQVVVDDLPTNTIHVGGRLGFGDDGKLYVSIGDVGDPANSQNASVRAGKLLRFNADGTIPSDNPTSGNPSFAQGLRNPFGLAFHPSNGTPYVSENGPSCDDELNRVRSGANFGWRPGDACGTGDDAGFTLPVARFNPSISPTGMTFYSGRVFPEFRGQLFMASFNDSSLRRFVVSGDGATEQERISDARFNRLTDVAQGPDGNLYVAGIDAITRVVRRD